MCPVTRVFGVIALAVAPVGAGLRAQLAEIPAPRVSYVRTVTSEKFVVTGEVTARGDSDFTIVDRTSEIATVQVTENTAILKGAVSIRLADLSVGDKVSVTAIRGGDGKLQAVNVTVRVGNE